MSYCTQQDMIDRFGESELIQLTDSSGLNEIATDRLARAIDDASAAIDGWLAGVYPLPLATVPAQLVRINCDMARYYLHSAGTVPELVEKRFDHAIDYLRALANGTVSLSVASEDVSPVAGVSQSTPDAVFDANQTRWP